MFLRQKWSIKRCWQYNTKENLMTWFERQPRKKYIHLSSFEWHFSTFVSAPSWSKNGHLVRRFFENRNSRLMSLLWPLLKLQLDKNYYYTVTHSIMYFTKQRFKNTMPHSRKTGKNWLMNFFPEESVFWVNLLLWQYL